MSGPVPGISQQSAILESGLEVASPHYAHQHHVAPEVVTPVASAPKQEGPYVVSAGAAIQEGQGGQGGQGGRICGLRRTTFWLSIVLVVVIIAAAVGGGVGGSIAVQNARAAKQGPSSAAATTSSSSSAALPTTTDALPLDCPTIDGTTTNLMVQSTSYPFKVDCSQDIRGGNLVTIIAYYFSDCMRACVGYNGDSTSTALLCKAVEFNSNLTYELQNNVGNCWLKSSSTTTGRNSNYPDNSYAAAVLLASG
ncbi:hypothetical protein GGI35DRAFT_294339 [Trichoderma velutinum]